MERKIVMVVDPIKQGLSKIDITRNDLEGNTANQTTRLISSLEKIAPVRCYYSVADFEEHINDHLNDIVFPMYYGSAGLTGKGIVPILCETHGIPYIGGDAYTQIVCNDKALSKQYAANFGIPSPHGCIFRSEKTNPITVKKLRGLKLPLVVKPNFGGGSTGISKNNIVNSYKEAEELARVLFHHIGVPILVEEYIEGYEVELIVVGTKKEIRFCDEVQLIMDGADYFQRDIWGFETKRVNDDSIDFKSSAHISANNRQQLLDLFQSFEKAEAVRFDGRVYNGQFYLLEISPDCYLGDDCAFYFAFQKNGFTHQQMLQFLINNSLIPY